uniref:Uncharacterized protein n=1 Tax=Iconisemion striatum TaxID=60296 RepID=A0A1A7Y8M0_9TELE
MHPDDPLRMAALCTEPPLRFAQTAQQGRLTAERELAGLEARGSADWIRPVLGAQLITSNLILCVRRRGVGQTGDDPCLVQAVECGGVQKGRGPRETAGRHEERE